MKKGAVFMSQLPGTSTFVQTYFEPDYQLPLNYQETYIVLMIRDPHCIFAYWEISSGTKENFDLKYGKNSWENSKLALRLFWSDTEIIMELKDTATNWYIHLENRGIPINGELGRLLPDNTFIPLAVSNYLFNFNLKTTHELKPGHELLEKTFTNWDPGITSF